MDAKTRGKINESNKKRLNTIYRLCSKGVSDTEISKKIGIDHSFVQKATTQYWKDKMDAKFEEE